MSMSLQIVTKYREIKMSNNNYVKYLVLHINYSVSNHESLKNKVFNKDNYKKIYLNYSSVQLGI